MAGPLARRGSRGGEAGGVGRRARWLLCLVCLRFAGCAAGGSSTDMPVARGHLGRGPDSGGAGMAGGVEREAWRVAVVLEPNCPIKVDYGLEDRCMTFAATNGSLPAWCPNYGLSSQDHKDHPSWSVTAPPYDNCYRGKAHYKAAYTAMFRRALPVLRRRGWSLAVAVNFGAAAPPGHHRESLENAHVIICTTKHYRLLVRQMPCKLYVLIAPDDPATLERGLDFNHEGILAVLQHTSVHPLSQNNMLPMLSRRSFKGSGHPQDPVHLHWMSPDKQRMVLSPRCPKLSTASLEKVVPLVPQLLRFRYPLDCGGTFGSLHLQGFFSKDRPPSYMPPLRRRSVDVMYVGASHQRSGALLRDHRQAVVAILNRMKAAHPHLTIKTPGRLEPQLYAQMLRDAKLFVSPFGLGEFSGKDYEAVLAGCLLVKPLADRIVTYPNIYKAAATLGVEASFADLEDKILTALQDIERSQYKYIIRLLLSLMLRQAMVDTQTRQLEAHDVTRFGLDVSSLLESKLAARGLSDPQKHISLALNQCKRSAAAAGLPSDDRHRQRGGNAAAFSLRQCRHKVPYGRAARWFRYEKDRVTSC